jgi:16S rRNA (adenine1518-N6/adenine1519-N6)-dimethyltransferase
VARVYFWRKQHKISQALKAKKSYGQHFLNKPDIARRIAQSLTLEGNCTRVLEVGPGTGMLTRHLLERGIDLAVVEADGDMVSYLEQHFPQLHGHIIHDDFLKFDLGAFAGGQPFALIGNFPYNISSQILFKMLENRHLIPEMVGMFQREVAGRVIAAPGGKDYGVLSVLVQAFYAGRQLFGVDRSCFSPPPKVQSAVIRLARKEGELGCDEQLFRKVVKLTFGQRRKMLRNTLKPLLEGDPVLEEVFFTRRPEQLSLDEFKWLTQLVAGRARAG